MILSAHQPAYLPWLGFFHKVMLADKFIILDDVQFEKNSFTNRNKIRSKSEVIWLSVPVKTKGSFGAKINELEIDNTQKWQKKHLFSIMNNYAKSPFLNTHLEFLNELYKKDWILLGDFLKFQLDYFLKKLAIRTEIIYQSHLQCKEKKQNLILELCQLTGADRFIFGSQGRDYAEEDFFREKQISIYFQDYRHPEYIQHGENFIPYLSIIDLLMNYDASDALGIIMSGNIDKESIRNI